MFVFTGIRSAQVVSHDEQQRIHKTKVRNKRKSLVKSVYEKQRKEDNLDYSQRSFPLRQYLMFCNVMDSVVSSNAFNIYILLCIVVAGILVGIETYDGGSELSFVVWANIIVLYSFVAEIVLKILSEGMGPQLYFLGSDWRWNLFDFFIVLISLLPVGASQVKILRLIRLLRVAKVFRKIPQLQMIIMGLYGGLESIMYIFLLMFLTFYMFAIAGILFFKANDPWHFRSVEISMLTLLRVATLDYWGAVFYINYYGCKIYQGDVYTNDFDERNNLLGGLTYCDTPTPQPFLAVLYFVSFIVMSAFCMLSLFIGAVSLAMAESMIKMRDEKEERRIAEQKLKIDEQIAFFEDQQNLDRKSRRKLRLIELAFTGQDLEDDKERVETSWKKPHTIYRWISNYSAEVAESPWFQNFVTFIIICAGVSVGMATDKFINMHYSAYLAIVDMIIQYIFVLEAVVKIVAEEFKPWRYFRDNWNKFDFFVVAAAFMPTGGGSTITILRLLRLLRVLKLMRALPQLQVLVTALLSGFSSIGFISILLMIFYYFFAIIGMVLFQTNDPWHFRTLDITMLVLFQCTTLDNWSSVMYTGLYGCEQFGGSSPDSCVSSLAQFAFSAIFWVIFILVGALVLLTLFIGVVNLSMEQAKQDQEEEAKIDARAMKIASTEELDRHSVDLYKDVFNVVDFTKSGRIARDEMRFGLKIAGLTLTEDDFEDMWSRVDKDKSSGIDFGEFLEFMLDLKVQLQMKGGKSEKVGKDGKVRVRRTFQQFRSQKSDGTDNKKSALEPLSEEEGENTNSRPSSPRSRADAAGSKYASSICGSVPEEHDEEVASLFQRPKSAESTRDRADVVELLNDVKLLERQPSAKSVTEASPQRQTTLSTQIFEDEMSALQVPTRDENKSFNDPQDIAMSNSAVNGLLRRGSSGTNSPVGSAGLRKKPGAQVAEGGRSPRGVGSSLFNVGLSRNRILPVELDESAVVGEQETEIEIETPEVETVPVADSLRQGHGKLLEPLPHHVTHSNNSSPHSQESLSAVSSLPKRMKPKSDALRPQDERSWQKQSSNNNYSMNYSNLKATEPGFHEDEERNFPFPDGAPGEGQQPSFQPYTPLSFPFPTVAQLASLPEPMVMIMMPQSHAATYYKSLENSSRSSQSPTRQASRQYRESTPQRQRQLGNTVPDSSGSFGEGYSGMSMDGKSISPSGRKICKSRICSI